MPVVACTLVFGATSYAADLAGVVVDFDKHEAPATLTAELVGEYKLKIDVDPKNEHESLAVRVELPNIGPHTWPAADVEVRNAQGQALVVRRSGIEWYKLLFRVPATRETYFVQAAASPEGQVRLPSEKERYLTDSVTGFGVSIARWYDGRQAALSIRFDDSHPTHVSTAIPILREYGFRGTFMVCPGELGSNGRPSEFEEHRAEWEACAQRGDQEFANHSMHHRGANGDEDMESEVGDAAEAIWALFPGKSKLMALNLGGGTQWDTTRTLRYYLDTYFLFDASQNSTGMDDSYGNRVANFQRILEQHIDRGLWCRIHYHSIGDGLSSTEANFRSVLDIAKEHEESLWIAGMADIYKYQTERNASRLALESSDARGLTFRLSCLTEPELYDQPLTIEVAPPQSWPSEQLVVKDAQGNAVAARVAEVRGQTVVRFDALPRAMVYTIEEGRRIQE